MSDDRESRWSRPRRSPASENAGRDERRDLAERDASPGRGEDRRPRDDASRDRGGEAQRFRGRRGEGYGDRWAPGGPAGRGDSPLHRDEGRSGGRGASDGRGADRRFRRDDDRGYGRRDDRRGRGGDPGRDERGGAGRREDRGGYGRREDRGASGRRDDRGARGGYAGRDDRGGYERRDDRGNRGGYEGRDDRGGYGRRDDRGGYPRGDGRGSEGRRDDRRGYGRRDDRPGDRRDNRGGHARRDERDDLRGNGARRDARGGYDRRDDRWGGDRRATPDRSDRGGYRGGYRGGDDRRDQRGGPGRRDDRPRFDRRRTDGPRGADRRGRDDAYADRRDRDDRSDRFGHDDRYENRRGTQGPGPRRIDRRGEAPRIELEIPEDVTGLEIDRAVKTELRTLSKDNAKGVGAHLVMVARLIDEDIDLARAHADAAVRRAGRVPSVREARGMVAYQEGDWSVALAEFRTARRLSGSHHLLPYLIDCERALGRPEKALELARSAEVDTLPAAERVEVAIVTSGIRRDLGQAEAALTELEGRHLVPGRTESWAPRLYYAYAEALLDLGRTDEARRWFQAAADADADLQTDAWERLDELDGTVVVDLMDDIEDDGIEDEDVKSEADDHEREPDAEDHRGDRGDGGDERGHGDHEDASIPESGDDGVVSVDVPVVDRRHDDASDTGASDGQRDADGDDHRTDGDHDAESAPVDAGDDTR